LKNEAGPKETDKSNLDQTDLKNEARPKEPEKRSREERKNGVKQLTELNQTVKTKLSKTKLRERKK
jgi:hypothetical protein